MKFHLILFTLAAVLFANPITKYAHSQVMGRSLPKGSVTKVVQTSEEESEEKKDAKEDKYEVNQNNMTEMRYFNNNLFPLIWNNDFNKGKTVVKTSTSLKKKGYKKSIKSHKSKVKKTKTISTTKYSRQAKLGANKPYQV